MTSRKLLPGLITARKLIKVVQYVCVIISEFNLMRYFIRVFYGRRPQKVEVEDWFKRFKIAGSSLSTTRMCLRLCMGIETIGYFLKQLRLYLKNSKFVFSDVFRIARFSI